QGCSQLAEKRTPPDLFQWYVKLALPVGIFVRRAGKVGRMKLPDSVGKAHGSEPARRAGDVAMRGDGKPGIGGVVKRPAGKQRAHVAARQKSGAGKGLEEAAPLGAALAPLQGGGCLRDQTIFGAQR